LYFTIYFKFKTVFKFVLGWSLFFSFFSLLILVIRLYGEGSVHTHARVHTRTQTRARMCVPPTPSLPPSSFTPNTHTHINVPARATKRPKKCKKYQNQCHMFMCKYRHKAKNVSSKTHRIKLSLHNLKVTAKSGFWECHHRLETQQKMWMEDILTNFLHNHRSLCGQQCAKGKVSGHL
jgi:hypothetical protein